MMELSVSALVLKPDLTGKKWLLAFLVYLLVVPSSVASDAHFDQYRHCFGMIQLGTKLTSNNF